MRKIIQEIEGTARSYFQQFGFAEEEITALTAQGKRDLETNLNTLASMLTRSGRTMAEEDSILHALKGLMLQLGDTARAETINEVRERLDEEKGFETIATALLEEVPA